MFALRLSPGIAKRLDDLARKTGRTRSDLVGEALAMHIADLEDLYLAETRVAEAGPRVSLDGMMAKYGVDADGDSHGGDGAGA